MFYGDSTIECHFLLTTAYKDGDIINIVLMIYLDSVRATEDIINSFYWLS